MIDLIFDTETTGKWDFKAPLEADHQPDLVQLAAILVDGPRVIHSFAPIVFQDCVIPQGAIDVHGISTEMMQNFGMSQSSVLATFRRMAKMADRYIAHNSQFDLKVMKRAYYRINCTDAFVDIPDVCTMKSSTSICNLPGKWGKPKWPTLQEAHIHFTGKPFEGAHDALIDTTACHAVLQGLNLVNAELLDSMAKV